MRTMIAAALLVAMGLTGTALAEDFTLSGKNTKIEFIGTAEHFGRLWPLHTGGIRTVRTHRHGLTERNKGSSGRRA